MSTINPMEQVADLNDQITARTKKHIEDNKEEFSSIFDEDIKEATFKFLCISKDICADLVAGQRAVVKPWSEEKILSLSTEKTIEVVKFFVKLMVDKETMNTEDFHGLWENMSHKEKILWANNCLYSIEMLDDVEQLRVFSDALVDEFESIGNRSDINEVLDDLVDIAMPAFKETQKFDDNGVYPTEQAG